MLLKNNFKEYIIETKILSRGNEDLYTFLAKDIFSQSITEDSNFNFIKIV